LIPYSFAPRRRLKCQLTSRAQIKHAIAVKEAPPFSDQEAEERLSSSCWQLQSYIFPFLLFQVGAKQVSLMRIPAKANADSGRNANGIPGRRRTVLGA
jgi:hypothetical protein